MSCPKCVRRSERITQIAYLAGLIDWGAVSRFLSRGGIPPADGPMQEIDLKYLQREIAIAKAEVES